VIIIPDFHSLLIGALLFDTPAQAIEAGMQIFIPAGGHAVGFGIQNYD
jgi:hypothetical protein